MGIVSAVEHIFHETAMQARTPAINRLAKAIRASHGARVSLQSQAKERVKENNGRSKGHFKGSKRCQRIRQRQNTGISGLENLKSETSSETQESVQMRQVCTTDTSWIHDEWKS